jgi:hypothetical protein
LPKQLRRTRTIRRLHLSGSGLAVVLASAGALWSAASALAATKPTGGTIGTFKFSRELSGTLKLPDNWKIDSSDTQAGCQKTVDPTSFNLYFYNVKLSLDGHPTALSGGLAGNPVIVNVQVHEYGTTESFANQSSTGAIPVFPASINVSVTASKKVYSWESNAGSATVRSSGTISTTHAGTSGSLSATLVPTGTGLPTGVGGHAKVLLTIKGSWSKCAAPPKI